MQPELASGKTTTNHWHDYARLTLELHASQVSKGWIRSSLEVLKFFGASSFSD
jgi:hypothetical protein